MAWVLLFTLSAACAGSFFFAEVALEAYPPFVIVLCRVAVAFICLSIVAGLRGYKIPREAAFWKTIIPLGILNNVIPFCAIVIGQETITSGTASIINATTPLFTLLVAHFISRTERISALSGIGILLGIAGVAVMFAPSIGLSGISENSLHGQLLIIVSSISYGFAFIFSGRMRSYPVILTAAGMLFVSSCIMLVINLFVTNITAQAFDLWPFLAMVAFGVFGTAFAYMVYFRLVNTQGVTFTSLCTVIIPALAVLLGVVFLDEPFGWIAFTGMLLILAGLLTLQLERKRRPKS